MVNASNLKPSPGRQELHCATTRRSSGTLIDCVTRRLLQRLQELDSDWDHLGMNILDDLLGAPLGYILFGCYLVFGQYGWAIIAFTLLTKIILLPFSIMAQRNAIKMVKMQPELDDIKRRFEGNNTLILAEQRALYSRERYSVFKGFLPLLVQIPVILGVIQVIYHPLRHLCHLSTQTIEALIARAAQLLGTSTDALGNGAQMRTIELVMSRMQDFIGVTDQVTLQSVAAVNLRFLNLDLGTIPSWTSVDIVWPFAAALSALALGLYQNRYYVLQRFAGPGSRWGITAFLILFSFYFSLILPGGFGLYWTAANVMSIVVVWVCNRIDDPRKLLNYNALTLAKPPNRADRIITRAAARQAHKRERADIKAFGKADVKLMIYSEGSGYWKYFARMIQWLISNTPIVVHYVTSDPDDQVFQRTNDQLRAYYVGPRALISFMLRLDCDICVMTTPDLDKYHIKRSLVNHDIEYVYLDHGMTSFHMTLREGALDHFDTIFCNGPNHITEIRQTEAVYNLPAKRCVKTGFGLFDDLLEAVRREDHRKVNSPPVALVAPSWQPQNLLELCPDDVIQPLLDAGFKVIVRPHPEFVRRFRPKLDALEQRFADRAGDQLEFQTDFSSNATVYEADIVVTDWSSIAQEFSYATKKPTLFINTPMKVMNHGYKKISTVPLDISLRDKIGQSLDVDALSRIGEVAENLVADCAAWHDRIASIVDANIFNIGGAAQAMGEYIVEALRRHQIARDLVAAKAATTAGNPTDLQKALLLQAAKDARLADIDRVEAEADELQSLADELRVRVKIARAAEMAHLSSSNAG